MNYTEKTRILIVEDDALIAEDLDLMLTEQGYFVVGKAYNAMRALSMIRDSRPDVVLLDIELDGETDGIDLAQLIEHQYGLPFLFVTSYYDDQTLARVKAVNPVGYILKPLDEYDLKVGLQLGIAKHSSSANTLQVKNKLFVKDKHGLIGIDPEKVVAIEADDNYCWIYTKGDKKYIVHQTLKSLKARLSQHQFFQSHRSHLVNFNCIEAILENEIVAANRKIPIGKTYKKELLHQLDIL